MWQLIGLIVLACFGSTLCLTDVDQQCIDTFNEDFSNDILIGTWYQVVKLTLFGGLMPTSSCPTYNSQKVNGTELQRYKDEYLTDDIPYSFDDNPLLENSGVYRPEGLLIGNKQAKFFIMDPSTIFARPRYEVRVYQRINDKYVLFHECRLRGNRMWLMSTKRNPPFEELDTIIKSRPETARMQRQILCYIF